MDPDVMKRSIPKEGMEGLSFSETTATVRWVDCPAKTTNPFCWKSMEHSLNSTCQNLSHDDSGVYCMYDDDEEIKEIDGWWEQLKMMAYWLVRIPVMFFDRQKNK